MRELNKIIQSLNGKPVSAYSQLIGEYQKNGIQYNVRNIYGVHYKYATIEVVFELNSILGSYQFDYKDIVPVTNHIMREFALAAHLANDSMCQSEYKVQKGLFVVNTLGNRVLLSSAVRVNEREVKLHLTVKLPYNTAEYSNSTAAERKNVSKRRDKGIISAKAMKILLVKNLPTLVENFVSEFDPDMLEQAVLLWKNQEFIRSYLKQNGYVSFIANGSFLPRKGNTDYKDAHRVVPFRSPTSMELTIPLPNGTTIIGMAIPKGITLITGEAYHGKSTILDAIKEGVYNHIIGDGREYVITDQSAMAIYSEDGRSVKNTDISFFLKKIPVQGIIPADFTTDHASGSTSQAAAVTEAIEVGCKLMLFDEDRSANNFMYKDQCMKSIIKSKSTIPFIDNARMFYKYHGISSIMVVGASANYFRISDKIILVDNFLVSEYFAHTEQEEIFLLPFSPYVRHVDFSKISKYCLSRNIEIKDNSSIKLANETIDIGCIISHVSREQLTFICSFIYYMTVLCNKKNQSLKEAVKRIYQNMDSIGIENFHQKWIRGATEVIEYVRYEDMMAIMFRLRSILFRILQVKS